MRHDGRVTPDSPAPSAFAVCFVCTGNICRSPMAEVVLRSLAEQAGLGSAIEISSAGTGEWHLGEHADSRALAALERLRGIRCELQAVLVTADTSETIVRQAASAGVPMLRKPLDSAALARAVDAAWRREEVGA